MIEIDGSEGEGGGQVIRTATAMSAITKIPVKITRIRAGRKKPGLKPQHINAINAVAKLCNAEVKGCFQNSSEIEFYPGSIEGADMHIDIGTAGSITLVLQAMMIPCAYLDKKINISLMGGTDVAWSPPIDYLKSVTLEIMRKFGYNAEVEIERRGFYPKGGGQVVVRLGNHRDFDKINLEQRGEVINIRGISFAHRGLEGANVAKRQKQAALKYLYQDKFSKNISDIKIKTEYCDALSCGSGIVLWAQAENTVIGASASGERGRSSEKVGAEAAANLTGNLNSPVNSGFAALDEHAGDQIVPYLALCKGCATVSKITGHLRTNVDVVNRFGYNVELDEKNKMLISR